MVKKSKGTEQANVAEMIKTDTEVAYLGNGEFTASSTAGVGPAFMTPNKVVGYRIRTDSHNYNVVIVKEHGPESKSAGQQYDTTLAHCKNPEFAINWLFDYVLRTATEKEQAIEFEKSGEAASLKALQASIATARAECLAAIKDWREIGCFEDKAARRALGLSAGKDVDDDAESDASDTSDANEAA